MQYRKRCEKASPSAIYRLFQSVFLQLPHDRRLVDLQLFSDFTRCTAGLLRVGQDLQLLTTTMFSMIFLSCLTLPGQG